MKKYQQLILAVISIFSFSCLLIYRHEYNRLHYVLEVLNFFGTPGMSTVSPPLCTQNATFAKFSADVLPAWQRVSNTLYIYSAYWEKVKNKEHVKAFAVGVLNENLNYGCYLWFDSGPKTRKGQFSFSGLGFKNQDVFNKNRNFGKSRTKGFVFYCEAETEGRIPKGVTFYKTSNNDTYEGFLPVVNLKFGSSDPVSNTTGICVMPVPFPKLDKNSYLEFLTYHKVVGVNNFIVYGVSDQYDLFSFIQSHHSKEIELKILPWNYPFFGDYQLMKAIAENDCLTRLTGVFENILVLEWNKFFVPRFLSSISKILNELDYEKKISKFLFPTLLFCTEYPDDINSSTSSPVLFRKTKFSISKVDISVTIYRPHLKPGHTQKFGKKIAAAHQYTSCQDFKLKAEQENDNIDTSIFAFQNKFFRSIINYKYVLY